jgi:phosphonatase-like hydrolase
MSAIKLVVFDMAGTTVRDRGNVGDSFIAAFHEYGFDLPRADVEKVMGFRKMDAIRILLDRFYPGSVNEPQAGDDAAARPDALITGIHKRFIDRMIAFYENDGQLQALPHAEEAFSRLQHQGIKVALNTGFNRAVANTLLRRLHWDHEYHLIDRVICSDEVPRGRPYPDMIRALMTALGIGHASQVLKIGDTEVDIEEGRNAGCGIVAAVTTGAYTRSELEECRPDFILDDLGELVPIVENAVVAEKSGAN